MNYNNLSVDEVRAQAQSLCDTLSPEQSALVQYILQYSVFAEPKRDGLFFNKQKAKQLVDFSRLCTAGTKYPTDIDAAYELNDVSRAMYEVKEGDCVLQGGQKLYYERYINDMRLAGKFGVVALLSHEPTDLRKDIDIADCTVRSYLTTDMHKWAVPKSKTTAMDFHAWFTEKTEELKRLGA